MTGSQNALEMEVEVAPIKDEQMLESQNALEMEVALIKDDPLCVGLKVTYAVKPEQ